ncbi:MAG: hypothetical protein GEU76_01190 [Alphaproteobacteria bacterium]|nr:hypothetical protein [Alphaproteobacteria bacterium]
MQIRSDRVARLEYGLCGADLTSPLPRRNPRHVPVQWNAGLVAPRGGSTGSWLNSRAGRSPGTPRWLCQFDLTAEGKAPVELRLFLRVGRHAATETWLYQFHPAG